MASGISILNFCLIETTHHVLCVSLYIPAGIIFAQPFAWGDQLDAQILLRLKLLLQGLPNAPTQQPTMGHHQLGVRFS